jgi:hypothetical protein
MTLSGKDALIAVNLRSRGQLTPVKAFREDQP